MPIHSAVGTLTRKTSLLRTVPTACGQAADNQPHPRPSSFPTSSHDRSSELAHERDFHHARCSERSYLFTMSDILRRYRSDRIDIARLPCGLAACEEERAIVISRTRKPLVTNLMTGKIPAGGARRDRTDDLLLAKQALSQLSYGPSREQQSGIRDQKLCALFF
jgi:hypothetical protein